MRQRLDEILRRLGNASPFLDGNHAAFALDEIVRSVEDELSGIPEDPNAHLATTSDGRMYPPHDRFKIKSQSPHITAFGFRAHKTYIGDNGALLIIRRTGEVEIDLPGADGKTIEDLSKEIAHEPD